MELPPGRPPFLINADGIDTEDLIDACQVLRVPAHLVDFILRQQRTMKKAGRWALTLDEVAAVEDVGSSSVRRWLKQLAEVGLLAEHRKTMQVSNGKNRKVLLFELNHPTADVIHRRREKEREAALRLVSKDDVVVLTRQDLTAELEMSEQLSMYINMVWSLLFPALSYSRRDKTEQRSVIIETEWSERIPVTVTSHRGTPIARVTDMLFWSALVSLCLDDLRDRKMRGVPLSNKFTILGANMAKRMRVSRTENITSILRRLNNTQVNLQGVPERIMRKNWRFDKIMVSTSFIHELVVGRLRNLGDQDGQTEAAANAWVYQWQLPHYVYDMLLAKLRGNQVNLITISPGLLEERNNVISALHLYFRRVLSKIDIYQEIPLKQLHAQVAPAMPRSQFFELLGEGIKTRHREELRRIDSHEPPLRVKTTDNFEPIPFVPIEPVGFGENPLSKHLPTLANIECHGFEMVLTKDRVQVNRNANDPIVGSFSEVERQALKSKAQHKPRQMSMLGDDPDSVDLDF